MATVTLIVTKPHSYGGKFRQVGETFIANRADARVLKALRKATDATQTYRTAALTPEPVNDTPEQTHTFLPNPSQTYAPPIQPAESAVEATADPDVPQAEPEPESAPSERPRRRYRRRDLTAEGDDSA